MCDYAERICKMMNNRGFQIKMQLIGKGLWKVRFDYFKKNEVYIKVETEPNIARELSDFLHLKCLLKVYAHI